MIALRPVTESSVRTPAEPVGAVPFRCRSVLTEGSKRKKAYATVTPKFALGQTRNYVREPRVPALRPGRRSRVMRHRPTI